MISKNIQTTNPLLYNITLKIHSDLSAEWLEAMKEEFLPNCTDGKVIVSSQINELLIASEDGDITYAVQFIFASKEIYDQQGLQALDKFLKLLDSKFQNKYVYFTTKMEILHYHTVLSDN